MKHLLGLIFVLALCLRDSSAQQFIPVEIPWGNAVRLADFGGPDLEVGVKAREMTHVVAEITDYTRLVPIARANVQGVIVDPNRNSATVLANPDAKMVPMRTTVRVEKTRGVPFEGGRYEMYLLFEEPDSGLRVYFLGSIARQNHDNLVVAIPKPARRAKVNCSPGPNDAPEVIPELTEWYDRLLKERERLDLADAQAVERFNRRAADYHTALEKMRAAREALKRGPEPGRP